MLKPGDRLHTHCTWDTTRADGPVQFGPGEVVAVVVVLQQWDSMHDDDALLFFVGLIVGLCHPSVALLCLYSS